jgi:transposase
MNQPSAAMHVATIKRKHGDRSYVSHLLRQSYRHDGKVKHRTLANLTHLPEGLLDLVRRSLQGEVFLAANETIRTLATKPHGHVQAILTTCRQLDLENLLASKPSRQRSVALALIVQRLLSPCSKLASLRYWRSTTLTDELDLGDVSTSEVYQALDWLGHRQQAIEQKLAKRHLQEGGVVLYDISSSYYEGHHCPLAHYGHNRDGKKGLPIIVYGLLTDPCGRPVAVDVYPGNKADSKTIPDQIVKVRQKFGLTRVILVGDRGMLTQTQIDTLKEYPGLGWISALRSEAIGKLIEKGLVYGKLFDSVSLAEIVSPDFPGERLVACYNPLLATQRSDKRKRLLEATEVDLKKLAAQVRRRTKKPLDAAAIGLKAGKVIGRHKMAKHFQLQIADGSFSFSRDEEAIKQEEQLDGIYVIRTSETAKDLVAADCVRTYKSLAQVERAFRCLKGLDVLVRPIRHRVEPRVRAHVLLCMLAYYVEWHMRKALKPLLYEDEELDQGRRTRDPVKPAKPSASAQAKKKTHKTATGLMAHDFRSLLAHLGARSRVTFQIKAEGNNATFQQVSQPDEIQEEALRLLERPVAQTGQGPASGTATVNTGV